MFDMFKKKYENVTVDQVKNMLADPSHIIIDVRETNEFNNGHIPNARLIPLGTLQNSLNSLDKDKNIIVVCASGGRSARAASLLSNEGYKVSNMMGGMMAWSGPVK